MSIEELRTDDMMTRVRWLTREVQELRAQLNGRAGGTVYPNGLPAVTVGVLSDGTYGIEILDESGGTVFKVTNSGQSAPYQLIPLGTPSTSVRYDSTSATYETAWVADFWCTGTQLSFYYSLEVPSGQFSVRVQVSEFGGGTTVLQTDTQTASGIYLVEQPMPAGAVGSFFRLEVQIKRDSGAATGALGIWSHPVNRPA